jgi:diaminopimelate decarboxylase
LPDSAAIDDDGELCVGGLRLTELAEQFGTPLFVYDEDHLRARARDAVAAFGPGVNYASKAFLCRAMARLAYDEGMHLDVSTGGEYAVARAAGVPASALVLHGNNKSTDELRLALAEGVGRVMLDSFDELDRIEALVGEGLVPPKVLIRLTPGIEAHTHSYVQTGQDDSKFGFGIHTGAAEQVLARAGASHAVEVVGLHLHIGSQIFDATFFERAIEAIAPWLHAHELPELSVGGGIGVAYVAGEQAPSFGEWAARVHEAATSAGVNARITAEPGRAIVAQAGVTLYTVGTIKHIPGIRTYVSVDGGMSDNPRPVLYGSGYEAFLPRDARAERPRVVSIAGKHCESGDVLVRDVHIAPPEPGDILVTPSTGAYGYAMANNYNAQPRPAVVMVGDGRARVIIERETWDDVLRLQRPLVP